MTSQSAEPVDYSENFEIVSLTPTGNIIATAGTGGKTMFAHDAEERLRKCFFSDYTREMVLQKFHSGDAQALTIVLAEAELLATPPIACAIRTEVLRTFPQWESEEKFEDFWDSKILKWQPATLYFYALTLRHAAEFSGSATERERVKQVYPRCLERLIKLDFRADPELYFDWRERSGDCRILNEYIAATRSAGTLAENLLIDLKHALEPDAPGVDWKMEHAAERLNDGIMRSEPSARAIRALEFSKKSFPGTNFILANLDMPDLMKIAERVNAADIPRDVKIRAAYKTARFWELSDMSDLMLLADLLYEDWEISEYLKIVSAIEIFVAENSGRTDVFAKDCSLAEQWLPEQKEKLEKVIASHAPSVRERLKSEARTMATHGIYANFELEKKFVPRNPFPPGSPKLLAESGVESVTNAMAGGIMGAVYITMCAFFIPQFLDMAFEAINEDSYKTRSQPKTEFERSSNQSPFAQPPPR